MHAKSPTRAVLYAAKSTEDKRGSIETQLADCRGLAEAEGYEVVGEYVDEAKSGYSGNRGPNLERALEHAEREAAECGLSALIVQHSDRLGRGDGKTARHTVEYALWALKGDVKLRSVQDDQTFGDLLYAVVMGQRNHEDSRRKSLSVRDGKRRAFERGDWCGGPLPDGLAYDDRGRIVIDPTRAPIVRRIFELADAGMADASIMRRLNGEGLRTDNGIAWCRSRIQDTLKNAVYAGFVVWHRHKPDEERRPGTHPALIDLDVFERVQQLRASRDRAVGSNRKPGRRGERFLLWGLATCARCGGPMRGVVSTYRRKDGTQKRTYACQHYLDCDGICDAKPVDAQIVETAFVHHLQDFFVDFDGWVEGVTQKRASEREVIEHAIEAENDRITEHARRALKLENHYTELVAADDPEASICARTWEAEQAKAAQAEHRLSELRASLEAICTEQAPVDALLDLYNALAAAVRGALVAEEMRDVNQGLRDVLERVELNGMLTEVGSTIVRVQPVLRSDSMPAFYLDALAPTEVTPPLLAVEADPEGNGQDSQEYRWTKPNRGAFPASQP